MNIFSLPRSAAKLFLVVLFCLSPLNLGLPPATIAYAATDPSMSTSNESSDPCTPRIIFTSVPKFGSKPPFTDPHQYNLYGRVKCVDSTKYKMVVYIYPGSWWVKPTFANPLTPINSDGTWMAKIRTGGIDELATQIVACVVPKGIDLVKEGLLLGGNATIPDKLYDPSISIVCIQQDRYRTIKFSGLTWNVRSNEGKVEPGPNYFSAGKDKVWVDASGKLHLTITYNSAKERWYCTEIFTQVPLGYGSYTFTTASAIDELDQNAVLGLFVWDDNAPQHNYREIDIEISRWGDPTNENSQYVVQPWGHPGNINRFNTILDGIFATFGFTWQSDQVFFSSHQGHEPTLGDEIASWLYTGVDTPPAGEGNARINLWLSGGLPPSDGQNIEVVLEAFRYDAIPSVTSITRASPNPTDAASVDFSVNFAEAVTGVDASDFEVVTTGVTGASISAIGGSGSSYTVTVDSGTGAGTIRLDVTDDDTILDATGSPLGGTGMSNGNFTNGEIYDLVNVITSAFESQGNFDGWILETSETSNMGGKLNKDAVMLYLGDHAANRQYRSLLSFDTSSLPDDAAITSVALKFKFAGKSGTIPFSTHGKLLADICEGAYNGNPDLEPGDFKPVCSKNKVLSYTNRRVDNWYSQLLNPIDFEHINLSDVTQFRLRFSKDDNNDFGADLLKIFSGNAVEADRPQLIVKYYIP